MRKRKNACCHYFYSTLLLLSLNSSKKSTVRKENPKMPLFGINREKSHSTHNVSFFLESWRAMLPFLRIVCRTRIPRNPGEQSGLFAFPLFYFICFSSAFPLRLFPIIHLTLTLVPLSRKHCKVLWPLELAFFC